MQYPKLIESKTAAHEVATIEWNPGMDLLATVFKNGTLTCSRLLSLQKVWHKQSCGKVASIAWRPDGRVLAVGSYDEKTKQNMCTLHDVEDGRELHSIVKDEEIISVSWFSCMIDNQKEREDNSKQKKSISDQMMANENFSHPLAHNQSRLNILTITTNGGHVSLYALGLFFLGQLDIESDNQEALLNVLKLHMSRCMRYITCWFELASCSTLRVFKLDVFHERNHEILQISKLYAKITDELEYLNDTLSAITTSWTDVLAGLDNKLSSYCSRKATVNNANESCSNYTFISADDLLQLLVLGIPSDNLEKFLADMSDKGLRKLNNAIEQTCLRVQNLIVKNAQKCCYHLHNDLNMLRGMSLWLERYKIIGLENKPIVEAMRDVGSLILKLTELQQVIDHSLKSTKSFFRWLISIACRLSGEQNNSVIPSDVNKTTQQDIQLITDFILENFDYNNNDLDSFLVDDSVQKSGDLSQRPTCSNFTLEQVGQYLKNEPLTRLKYSFTKPDSNFWIEFFKQRPEMTELQYLEESYSNELLFYPHNSNTSLIQEHKRACQSIEKAFENVAENTKRNHTLKNPHLNMDKFLKISPTQKIRVETDPDSKNHYTLFQTSTKSPSSTKQFLIVQALPEKLYKYLSIEFRTIPNTMSSRQSTSRSSSGTGILLISDSGFYENKETKKMLLSFLLIYEQAGDTILVQVELDKVLALANCPDRTMSSTRTVKEPVPSSSSARVTLRIDLNTQPACDRNHEPEMMVKRIKGVVGKDMFLSSSRGVIAFTSCDNKRLHLYELESSVDASEIMGDDVEGDELVDESLIDTDLMG